MIAGMSRMRDPARPVFVEFMGSSGYPVVVNARSICSVRPDAHNPQPCSVIYLSGCSSISVEHRLPAVLAAIDLAFDKAERALDPKDEARGHS